MRKMAEMRRLVEEFEHSGVSRRKFCERHDVPLPTLDYWRRRVRSKPKVGMVSVKLANSVPVTAHAICLSLTNGRRIECGWDFADECLARLIRTAEEA